MATLAQESKTCSGCGEVKLLAFFRPSAKHRYGRHSRCRACEIARMRLYRKENPEYVKRHADNWSNRPKHVRREYMLQRRYGLNIEGWNELFEEQGGVCAICGDDGNLHVDHRDDPFLVRGLLCGRCNRAIGLLKHNTETILAAARYMERF